MFETFKTLLALLDLSHDASVWEEAGRSPEWSWLTTNKCLARLETTANVWIVLESACLAGLVWWFLLVDVSRPLTRMVTALQPTITWNVSKQMQTFETSWKPPALSDLSRCASWWRQKGHSLKWSQLNNRRSDWDKIDNSEKLWHCSTHSRAAKTSTNTWNVFKST